MRVALVQHDVAFEDPVATCDHVAPLVQAAAGQGAAACSPDGNVCHRVLHGCR